MARKVQAALFGALLFFVSAAGVFGTLTLTQRDEFDALTASSNQVADYYHHKTASGWESFVVRNADAVHVSFYLNHQGRVFELSEGNAFLMYEKSQSARSFDEVKQEATRVFESLKFSVKEDATNSITFENSNKYCQVRTISPPLDSFALHCASSVELEKNAELASKLFKVAERNGGVLAGVSEDARVIVSVESTANANIQYATLSFSGAEQSQTGLPRLLFGAIDGRWEYVANLHDASLPSDGKRSVSHEDLARMNDTKWEGYLSNVY